MAPAARSCSATATWLSGGGSHLAGVATDVALDKVPCLTWAIGRCVVAVGGETNRPVDGVELVTDDGWVRSAGLAKMREAPWR